MAVKEERNGTKRVTVVMRTQTYREIGRRAVELDETVNKYLARLAEEAVRKK